MPDLQVAMSIVKNSEDRVLVLHKNLERTEKERYMENPWETPGGKIEKGERPVEAARRELKEETGLESEFGGSGSYSASDLSIIEEFENPDQTIEFFPVPLTPRDDHDELSLSAEHDKAEWVEPEEFRRRLPEHNVEGMEKALGEFS